MYYAIGASVSSLHRESTDSNTKRRSLLPESCLVYTDDKDFPWSPTVFAATSDDLFCVIRTDDKDFSWRRNVFAATLLGSDDL